MRITLGGKRPFLAALFVSVQQVNKCLAIKILTCFCFTIINLRALHADNLAGCTGLVIAILQHAVGLRAADQCANATVCRVDTLADHIASHPAVHNRTAGLQLTHQAAGMLQIAVLSIGGNICQRPAVDNQTLAGPGNRPGIVGRSNAAFNAQILHNCIWAERFPNIIFIAKGYGMAVAVKNSVHFCWKIIICRFNFQISVQAIIFTSLHISQTTDACYGNNFLAAQINNRQNTLC